MGKTVRRVSVHLTSEGRKFNVPHAGTIESAVQRALTKSRPAEVRALRAVLARVIEALESEV